MPFNPLLIKSKPSFAYFPTPGNLDIANNNKRNGPVLIFIMASNTIPIIGMIAANALIATLATETTAFLNVSLLL